MPLRRSGRDCSASGWGVGCAEGCWTESVDCEDIVASTFLGQPRGTVGRSAAEEKNRLPGTYRQRAVLSGGFRVGTSLAPNYTYVMFGDEGLRRLETTLQCR
ncbi:hypothetical protein GCM10009618_22150 [Nesterenkonia lacusekhoensis]